MADNVRLLHGKTVTLNKQPVIGGKIYFAITDDGIGEIYFDAPPSITGTSNAQRIKMNTKADSAEKDNSGNLITGYVIDVSYSNGTMTVLHGDGKTTIIPVEGGGEIAPTLTEDGVLYFQTGSFSNGDEVSY